MSYQVLARKWRPRSFREMVGQTHVLRALINALDSQRLHHAYLFTGTRGVGKTTIARIIAKCLNCEVGVSSTPCGVCSICKEIDEGRFIDLIEVDAASRTKVEDTRELLDNVQYAPSRGRFKVYLIDEVHMLSSHSFNALLKTLEEPPPHVKFLLATTDPQKLPVTILSRCLQFSLKNMPPERVVEHLTHVLGVEEVPFEVDALWLLGRAADGSMRDAMSLTDQAIAFGEGKVMAADVRAMLGTLDHGQVYGVLQALLEGDARGLIEAVRHLAEQGPDWAGVLAEILNVLHRVAIAQALPEAVDNGQGDRDRVLALAQALPAEDVQFYYQMGLIGRRDLPLAPEPRSGFEMVLLRMLAFRPEGSGPPPKVALKPLGISSASADPQSNPVAGAVVPIAAPLTSPVTENVAVLLPEPVVAVAPLSVAPVTAAVSLAPAVASVEIDLPWNEPQVTTLPVMEPVTAYPATTPVPVVPERVSLTAVAPSMPAASDADSEDDEDGEDDVIDTDVAYAYLEALPDDAGEPVELTAQVLPAALPATGLAAQWLALFPQLALSGLTASIAGNCSLVAVDGDHWLLHLDPAQGALFNSTQQQRVNDALNQFHGRKLTLDIQLRKPEQETPAQAAARKRIERQSRAVESIHADPLVQQMVQQFGASVRADSIEPVDVVTHL
jgi:DNA polymerase III subunit gamma/tau